MIFANVDTGIDTYSPTTKVMWSVGRNVRFKPGCVYKTLGKKLLKATGTLPIRAMFTFKGIDDAIRTIVCHDDKVFVYNQNFSQSMDITPTTPPTGNASDIWDFALVVGLPILTNGKNGIWKWTYTGRLSLLANAPLAKTITNSLHRLMCGNVREGGNFYPSRIRWSVAGKPEDWDIRLAHAGRHDLVKDMKSIDAKEKILALKTSGKKTYVFTERNIWVATPVENEFHYSWDVIEDIGLIAPRLVVSSKGVQYFMSNDDFYILSDNSLIPIGLPISNLFQTINKSAINTGFAFEQKDTNEIFFCVPTGQNNMPDTAFVYNVELKNWTLLDVDYICHSSYFDDTKALNFNIVGDANGNILLLDSGYSNNQNDYMGYIETGDISMQDSNIYKIIRAIIPVVSTQEEKTDLMIQVGTRASLHHDISWSQPVPYTIGVSEKASFRKQGKFIRIRFFSEFANTHWELQSFAIDYLSGGSR